MTVSGNQRYSSVAIALHWAIAGLIMLNLSIGWFMEGLAEPGRTFVVRIHESSGMTVLALTAVRILWRLAHRPPPLDPRLSNTERMAASTVHFTFYLAMVAIPISGWALVSANPPHYEAGAPKQQKYILLWGTIPLHPIAPIQAIAMDPGGVVRQHVLHERIVRAHTIAGYGLLAFLVLHILGALKHQFIDRHDQLARMGFRRKTAS